MKDLIMWLKSTILGGIDEDLRRANQGNVQARKNIMSIEAAINGDADLFLVLDRHQNDKEEACRAAIK